MIPWWPDDEVDKLFHRFKRSRRLYVSALQATMPSTLINYIVSYVYLQGKKKNKKNKNDRKNKIKKQGKRECVWERKRERERIGRGLVTVLSEKEVKKRKQREKERSVVGLWWVSVSPTCAFLKKLKKYTCHFFFHLYHLVLFSKITKNRC